MAVKVGVKVIKDARTEWVRNDGTLLIFIV